MKKCLVWGISDEYTAHINQINYEILKGNISIQAMVSRDRFSDYIDGKKIISKNEISSYDYDFIIIFNKVRYQEIKEEAIQQGANEKKIINGSVFGIPNFDFLKYISLIENPITIISDDCFGANIYHYLGLEFTSPFILFYFDDNDYIKLLKNLDYYLEQQLCIEQDSDISTNNFPIGSLGYNESKILLYFNHYNSFEQAKDAWERRVKRINKNNIFIKMTIPNDDIARQFDELPYTNKVGFYYKQYNGDSIKYVPRYNWRTIVKPNIFGYNFKNYIRNMKHLTESCDALKMLLGEKDFMREI